MEVVGTRKCQRCGGLVSVDDTRLLRKDANTTTLVCSKCCEEVTHKKMPDKVAAKPRQYTKKMICRNCNYKFGVDQSAGVLHRLYCPYCSRDDKLEEL